jgi:hypothetical protein
VAEVFKHSVARRIGPSVPYEVPIGNGSLFSMEDDFTIIYDGHLSQRQRQSIIRPLP